MKLVNLNLPEWVFWDAHSHEGDKLKDRTVIEHVRSASVFEIFDRDIDTFRLNPEVLTFRFKNEGLRVERLLIALHHSCTLDPVSDRKKLMDIMKQCAIWYCDYCDWEDKNEMI